MEPQLPTPHSSPENEVFSRGAHTPEVSSPQHREGQPRSQERGERQETRERVTGAGAGDTSPAAAPQLPHAQSAVGVQVADDNTQQDDTPLVAGDEDLIEMEWVNKAKKIVNETKTDPYQQERAVGRLQASYLLKRYGKEVKLPKDE